MVIDLLRKLIFWGVIWPFLWLILGIWVRNRQRIPEDGPAILYANHNSHLDLFVILALCSNKLRRKLRPIAAKDYWFSNAVMAWISTHLLGIIPLDRGGKNLRDVLKAAGEALDRGEALLIFPEGTRGEPETMGELKSGITMFSERRPDVPVVPIFLYGLGKALPRGEALFVPFVCDAYVGEPFKWHGDRKSFMVKVRDSLDELRKEARSVDPYGD
jgi:1-acyl-sn-glycerol-3-phosphate acyltransferase